MRITVAGPVEAKRGQTLRFYASLRKNAPNAFCEVFSACGDIEPSPHVPHYKMQMRKNQPDMVNPTSFRLVKARAPFREVTVKADEDCTFYMMQDVDVESDPRVKARIKINGQPFFVQAFGWLLRNSKWLHRRRNDGGGARQQPRS